MPERRSALFEFFSSSPQPPALKRQLTPAFLPATAIIK
jgi:hypothetical protein